MPEEHEQMEEKLQRKFINYVYYIIALFDDVILFYRAVLAESQFA